MSTTTPVVFALTIPSAYADASGYVYVMASARNATRRHLSGPSRLGGAGHGPGHRDLEHARPLVELGRVRADDGVRLDGGDERARARRTPSAFALGRDLPLPRALDDARGQRSGLGGRDVHVHRQAAGPDAGREHAGSDRDGIGPARWSVPDATRGPFTYRVHAVERDRLRLHSGWVSGTSMPFVLAPGAYSWTVEAVDAAGFNYGTSLPGTFSVTYPSAALTPVANRVGTGPTSIAFALDGPTNGMSPVHVPGARLGQRFRLRLRVGHGQHAHDDAPRRRQLQLAGGHEGQDRHALHGLGRRARSSSRRSRPTAPVLTPVPSNGYMPGRRRSPSTGRSRTPRQAPFTYQLHVWDPYSSPTFEYTSGVAVATSTSVTLDGDHNYLWTVQAKDKDGILYPLSVPRLDVLPLLLQLGLVPVPLHVGRQRLQVRGRRVRGRQARPAHLEGLPQAEPARLPHARRTTPGRQGRRARVQARRGARRDRLPRSGRSSTPSTRRRTATSTSSARRPRAWGSSPRSTRSFTPPLKNLQPPPSVDLGQHRPGRHDQGRGSPTATTWS